MHLRGTLTPCTPPCPPSSIDARSLCFANKENEVQAIRSPAQDPGQCEDSSPAPAAAPAGYATEMQDLERTHFPPSGVLSKKGMDCSLRGSLRGAYAQQQRAKDGRSRQTFRFRSLPGTRVQYLSPLARLSSFFPSLLFCSFSFHLFSIFLSERVSVRLEPPFCPGSRARGPRAGAGAGEGSQTGCWSHECLQDPGRRETLAHGGAGRGMTLVKAAACF